MLLEVQFKEDVISGGWIAVDDDFNVVGQGDTKEQAYQNLKRDIKECYDVDVTHSTEVPYKKHVVSESTMNNSARN